MGFPQGWPPENVPPSFSQGPDQAHPGFIPEPRRDWISFLKRTRLWDAPASPLPSPCPADELEIPKLPDRKRVWAAIERLLGHGREAEADDSCASSPDLSLGYASSEASWSSVTRRRLSLAPPACLPWAEAANKSAHPV